ncbi:MAG6450 family protein [Alysiella filiformis]|uniref:Uncharacterized protein n=1 Tax=Alysiella filiformis DSM 16848 TaxID=1120981 RepID=A0A286E878_9NEIS|nr:hypothetical protein [Alysiella filiformis]QMT32062.1 hypothetical protein H3L97_04095 [Alysiella filiformis]UBQ57030.1 hypothetical protein JF568_04580 [Alysiella filiformis DSM 16848]SOD67128.1 hypothetical protein SAMN02746062_00810 [Alysiella filiformis DSM 16848]
MGQLDSRTAPQKGVCLDRREIKFKIRLADKMQNGFDFKKLSNSKAAKDFQNFLDETIGKDLSITEVDKLFLRKQGGVSETVSIPISKWDKCGVRDHNQPFDEHTEREIYHYGKDRKPFRLFGFYEDGYFVIFMIDPTHEKHSK